jgi:CheY-like chemotaxis protein
MTKKQILIIDDDRAVRDAFELALADKGYVVQLAEGGQIGLDLAVTQRPDLIFLDLKMPGMDGVETLRRLHAIDSTIPVYIVTAFAQEFMDQLRRARQEGMHFQLAAKPLSPAQIRIIAWTLLGGEDIWPRRTP